GLRCLSVSRLADPSTGLLAWRPRLGRHRREANGSDAPNRRLAGFARAAQGYRSTTPRLKKLADHTLMLRQATCSTPATRHFGATQTRRPWRFDRYSS